MVLDTTITEDPMKYQELFDQSMHHAMINQSKVMTNSAQKAIYQMMSGISSSRQKRGGVQ